MDFARTRVKDSVTGARAFVNGRVTFVNEARLQGSRIRLTDEILEVTEGPEPRRASESNHPRSHPTTISAMDNLMGVQL